MQARHFPPGCEMFACGIEDHQFHVMKGCAMNHKCIAVLLAAAFMAETPAFTERVTAPGWFSHKELLYPADQYISVVGEGGTEAEARDEAVAEIALFFKTTADICNELLRTYNESETSTTHSVANHTATIERARITSQTDFFGVQFTNSFAAAGRVYVLAFINRNDAFTRYESDIKQNVSVLQYLLSYAEDRRNAVIGYNCAKSAVSISALTAELIKNARAIKPADAARFSNAESLIERSYAALKMCRENLTFTIAVTGEWQSTVYTTLAQLLEARGYAVVAAEEPATTTLSVQVTADERKTAAGIFLYSTISVVALATDNKPYFSYARTFDKKGALRQADAYRLTYAMICDELKRSFIAEFDEHTQAQLR